MAVEVVTRLSDLTLRVKAAWQIPRTPCMALPIHTVKIGRARHCDCVVNDPTVSRVHAALRYQDGRWWLRDLRSTNGTCLNGCWIADEVQVRPGDRVSLGAATFLLAPPL